MSLELAVPKTCPLSPFVFLSHERNLYFTYNIFLEVSCS